MMYNICRGFPHTTIIMNYWIITDTHLGHDKLIKLCDRPENFVDKILKALANTVKEDDILIHLGDICWGNDDKWHQVLNKTVKSKRWLIRGNHDSKSSSWYLNHGWDFVGSCMLMEYYGHYIAFSHMPIVDIGYTDNIHGHFHNNDHRSHEPELVAIKNDKHRLIAIENTNYHPVNLKCILRDNK